MIDDGTYDRTYPISADIRHAAGLIATTDAPAAERMRRYIIGTSHSVESLERDLREARLIWWPAPRTLYVIFGGAAKVGRRRFSYECTRWFATFGVGGRKFILRWSWHYYWQRIRWLFERDEEDD